jgi:hypothetical protein
MWGLASPSARGRPAGWVIRSRSEARKGKGGRGLGQALRIAGEERPVILADQPRELGVKRPAPHALRQRGFGWEGEQNGHMGALRTLEGNGALQLVGQHAD